MKRPILSEKSLVGLLFVLVIVVFSFAQADTNNLENMNLKFNPPTEISLEQSKTASESQEVSPAPATRPASLPGYSQ